MKFRVLARSIREQIAASGNDVGRHGADIGELLAQLGPEKVLLVGWSFGVLDSGRKDVAYEDWHGHKLDTELLALLREF